MSTPLPSQYQVVPQVADSADHLARHDMDTLGVDADLVLPLAHPSAGGAADLDYDDAARIVRGAIYAAHAVRLWARALPDAPGWAVELENATPTFADADADRRRTAGLAIRRAVIGEHAHPEATAAAEAVGLWLTNTQEGPYVAAAAKIARWVMQRPPVYSPDDPSPLRDAWYAANGPHILRELAAIAPSGSGRPTLESARIRDAQRHLARETFASRPISRTRLAQDAGVTRVTLNAWLDK